MPEVGVINLTIHDNSEDAGKGLDALATALGSVKNKAKDFDLTGVAKQLNTFTRTIAAAKTSSAVYKNIAEFGKGLKDIVSATNSAAKGINAEPIVGAIEKIKGAVSEGMHLSSAGTQLKNIREALTGEWKTDNAYQAGMALAAIGEGARSLSGTGLGTVAKNVSAVAKALNEYADASAKVMGVVGEKSDKMAQLSDAARRQKEWFEAGGFATGKPMPLNLQMFASKKGSKQSEGQMSMNLDSLLQTSQEVVQQNTEQFEKVGSDIVEKIAVGIENAKDRVVQGTGIITDTIKQGIYSGMKLDGLVSSPTEAIYDQVRHSTKAIEVYQSAIGTTMQTQESMDAKAKMMADHIKETTKQIQDLIKYLDATPNPKGKGFDSIVNAVTGVTNQGKSSLINENTTMFKPMEEASSAIERFGVATSGVVSIFNSAKGAYEQVYIDAEKIKEETNEASQAIEGVTMKVENLINLEQMKTSGKNGVFANAADEANFLTARIEEAKQAQQQFNDIAAKAEKQLKYGGPINKDELSFNLRHATEGYYEAVQAEEKYKAALGDLLEYARETAASVKQVTDATTELPVTDAIKNFDDATQEASNGSMEEFKREIQDIANSTEPAISKIQLLQNRLSHLWGRVAELSQTPAVDEFGQDTGRDNAINDYMLRITQVYDQLNKLINKSHEAQEALRFDALKNNSDNLQREYGMDMVNDLLDNYNEIDLLTVKMEGMKQALADDINQNKVDTQQIAMRTIAIQKLEEQIKSLKDAQEDASRITKRLGSVFSSVMSGVSRMFPSITNIIKRFKSTIVSRSIRYAIREIAKGFSEGVQNVYQYSKAVGTDLAPAMDRGATALQQMKNSIGAAVAPVIQALVPVLQNVVNWFINLINYVNQFFALLNGQSTWTRALPAQASAFEENAKSAKGASKAMKDLLANWDELNIIQSESGGGGGSGIGNTAEDYKSMFEEVNEFSEEVKGIVSWIQDHMEMIKGIAAAIGVAILGWKLSKAFSVGLNNLSSLLLESMGIVVGLTLSWQGAYNAGLEGGFDLTTGLVTAGGILATTISSALIGFKVAGPWGALIGGATGLVLSLGTAISAYIDGDRTRRQAAKWGKLHLTDEQISDLVDQQVTSPVLVELEAMVGNIKNREDAKIDANAQITSFGKDLDAAKFMLSTDTEESSQSVQDALVSAREAIKTIQGVLSSDKEGLKLSFTKFTYKDKDGKDVTEELYTSMLEGNSALDRFFTDMGKDIAKFISDGFGEGLTEEEMQMAMNLMESLNNIVSTAESNYQAKKIVRDSQKEMNEIYDMDTAQKVLNKQQDRLAEYRDTTTKMMEEDLDSYYRNLEYYEGIKQYYLDKDDTKNADRFGKYIEDTLTVIANTEGWLKQIEEGTYWSTDKTYTGMQDRMTQMWRDKFSQMYGEQFLEYMLRTSDDPDTQLYKLLNGIGENPFENNPVAASIMNQFGISPYEMLNEKQISEYVNYVLNKHQGDQEQAYEEIQRNHEFLASNGVLSKYLPRGNTPSESIYSAIFNMLLSGVAEGSGAWNAMLDSNRKLFGPDFDDAYTNAIGGMQELYNQMIEDMFSGFTREQMEKKYVNNIDLAGLFMNAFPEVYGDPNMIDPRYVRFNELIEDLDLDELESKNTGRVPMGLGIIGSNGMSSFYRGETTPYSMPNAFNNDTTVKTEPANGQQDIDNTARGTEAGTRNLLDALNSILRVAEAINKKEFTINVNPSSAWGNHNARSQDAYDKVTGP